MNLYQREMKAGFKSLLAWVTALAGVTFFMHMLYPAISSNQETMNEVLEGFPPEVLKAFSLTYSNFSDVLQYAAYILSFILVAVAIFAMNQGSGMLSKEEVDKTAEFLLTRPIRREKVVLYKLLAAITNITLLNILLFLVVWVSVEVVKKETYSYNTLMLFCLATYVFQLLFMAIGFILSVSTRKPKSVSSMTLGIVFGFYGLSMLAGLFMDKKWIGYFTPFRYFDVMKIATSAQLEWKYVALSVLLILGMLGITFKRYLDRDITA